jgi:hypothetical protein
MLIVACGCVAMMAAAFCFFDILPLGAGPHALIWEDMKLSLRL